MIDKVFAVLLFYGCSRSWPLLEVSYIQKLLFSIVYGYLGRWSLKVFILNRNV